MLCNPQAVGRMHMLLEAYGNLISCPKALSHAADAVTQRYTVHKACLMHDACMYRPLARWPRRTKAAD